MLDDLPRRLSQHPRGRTVLRTVVAGFLLIQLGMIVRRALPAPLGGPLPWRMFHRVSSKNQSIRLSGVTETGEIIAIDGQRWFRFRSGASTDPLYIRHPALWGSNDWKDRNQRVFGRWLAHKVWQADGIALHAVWIDRTRVRIETGAAQASRRIVVPIAAEDRERAIPREAWVGPR
jgi:hypothetical protein